MPERGAAVRSLDLTLLAGLLYNNSMEFLPIRQKSGFKG